MRETHVMGWVWKNESGGTERVRGRGGRQSKGEVVAGVAVRMSGRDRGGNARGVGVRMREREEEKG